MAEFEIDPDGDEHMYVQLARQIVSRIEDGTYEPGQRLPSESSLMQESGLSRSAVRRTVAWLVAEDYAYTVPQRGSFVRKD
jgi:GntR family transcriptional regulator